MDFFKLFKNSTSTNQNPSTSAETDKKNTSRSIQSQSTGLQAYQNVKKGDRIMIVRLAGSPLNFYKGYLGEIREYRNGCDYAIVVLQTTCYPRLLHMPLNHFIKTG
jgi:hypothetical protein